MELKESMAAVEAILFASGEPVLSQRVADALETDEETIANLVTLLNDRYRDRESGLTVAILNDSYQLCTKDQYAEFIKKALEIRKNTPLSQAALEVLAIIAYNQPVTKSFVEQVRGVESGQIVNNLVEKGLVEEAGRLDVPGRPIAYKTTLNFLRCFGMNSLDHLPPLPDESGQVMMDEVVSPVEKKQHE